MSSSVANGQEFTSLFAGTSGTLTTRCMGIHTNTGTAGSSIARQMDVSGFMHGFMLEETIRWSVLQSKDSYQKRKIIPLPTLLVNKYRIESLFHNS
jgi:hypothetical protein